MKRLSLLLLVTVLLSGCVQFESRPLDPERTALRLESRSLTDPGLQAYLKEVLGEGDYADPARAWSLNELTAVALYFNPTVSLAWKRASVSHAEITGAAERPNPSLSVAPGYNSTSSGISPWIFELGLSFAIETAGKRKYRTEEARLKADAERLRVAVEAWRVRQGVRAALIDLAEAQETSELAAAVAAAQEQVCAMLEIQRVAGEASRFHLSQAQVEQRKAVLVARETEGQREIARAQLAAALGLPDATLSGTAFRCDTAVPDAAEPDTAVARKAALTGRAELLAMLKDYESSQAALRVAIAGQYPDLSIGPGYEFDQGEDKWSLGASLTLPVFHRNQGAIKKALAQREEAAAAVTAVQSQVLSEVDQALAALRASETYGAAADDMLGAMTQHLEAVEKLRKAGELMALDALIARADVARAKLDVGMARTKRRRALGQLEDALQRPVDLPDALWTNLPNERFGTRGEQEQL